MNPISKLWNRLARLGAPIPVEAAGVAPIAAPGIAQEEFELTPAQIAAAQARAKRVSELNRRIIETNNACVERGMGRYTDLVAYKPNMRLLTDVEMCEMAALDMGVAFVEAHPPVPEQEPLP